MPPRQGHLPSLTSCPQYLRSVTFRTAKVQILERTSQMATACTSSERQSHPLQLAMAQSLGARMSSTPQP